MPTLIDIIRGANPPPRQPVVQIKHKSHAPLELAARRRRYDEGPLPFKPSDIAPRQARIVSRTDPLEHQNLIDAKYTVRIGDVEIGDISVQEILDYVSALDLEEFENDRFTVEAEVQEAKRLATDNAERIKDEMKKLAVGRPKGVVGWRIPGEDVTRDTAQVEGREGRARPTYKHLFKPLAPRRRRKRHPRTGELLPLSDDDDDDVTGVEQSSADDDELVPRQLTTHRTVVLGLEPVKRRRRKRDPVTGELLPLSPRPAHGAPSIPTKGSDKISDLGMSPKVRPRRRRHPLTGELMPLGWRYDPDRDDEDAPFRDEKSDGPKMPPIDSLSLSQEPERKRIKSTPERPVGLRSWQSSTPPSVPGLESNDRKVLATPALQSKNYEEDVLMEERPQITYVKSPSASGVPVQVQSISSKDCGGSLTERSPYLRKTSIMNPTAVTDIDVHGSSSSDSVHSLASTGPQLYGEKTLMSPTSGSQPASQRMTSIMKPTVVDFNSEEDDDDDEDDVLSEGEYAVEKIMAHHMSDPRTHPPDLGTQPVMLYKVKWKGWDDPTWEPVSSFGNPNTVKEYHESLQRRADNGKGRA